MNHHKRQQKTFRGRAPARQRTPAEWMAVHLDFPPDVWSGGMRVELRGRNALTVHGCRKILSYNPEEIRLTMKGCTLSVRGKRLVCSSYLAGAVGIDGRVDDLSFEGEEPHGREVET